jgi:aminodeoxyfutalosine deaminase
VCRCLRTAEDFERVIVEHAGAMASQGIAYAEVSINPSLHQGESWIEGVVRARRRVKREPGVEIAWLIELARDETQQSNERSLDIALATEGVVGLGLVGDESLSPTPLEPVIARGRAAGLRFMPHAGQVGDASVVRDAIDTLHADRIAHGVSAIDDPALMAVLVDRGVCLCVCPSSNAKIGIKPDFRKLAGAGVTLTVNTDDPAMVETTLTRELELAESKHGLSRNELLTAAWRHRFT